MKQLVSFTTCLFFLAAVASSLASAAEDESTKNDLKNFEGTWEIKSLEIDGNKVDEKDAKKIQVINEANGVMAIEVDGKVKEHGQLKIYPTQKPKTVDLTATDGDSKGKTLLGIYEFDGDVRKVCYAPDGKERPTDFTAPAGSGRFLVVLKRIKK
jgi:uncharacterized protein (TIGR03067 family)